MAPIVSVSPPRLAPMTAARHGSPAAIRRTAKAAGTDSTAATPVPTSSARTLIASASGLSFTCAQARSMKPAMSEPGIAWPCPAPSLAASSPDVMAPRQSAPSMPELTAAATAAADAIATEVLWVARQVSATLATSALAGSDGIMMPTGAIRIAAPLVSPSRPATSGAIPALIASIARFVDGPRRS